MTRAQHLAAVGLLLTALASAGPAGAQTTIPGSNNVVVVGPMSGGTINNGFTAEQVAALQKAQGKQRDELLRKIVADLNQQAQRAAYTEGSVRQFVETLTRRQVPPGEWQQALGEITRRYLELETRLSAIPVTSEQIKALVARAEAARLDGRFDEADRLLGEAVQMARADARRLKEQFRASSRQAASALASQASLALTRLDRHNGVRLLVEAFEERADDVDSDTFWWLIEAGDAALADGRSARALEAYQRAQRAAQGRLVEVPGDLAWLRELSVSHSRIGNVQSAQGDLGGALKSFQAGTEIARKLAERDPGNAELQRDLVVSHVKIGEVQRAQGDLGGALKSFQAGTEIARKLTERDPGNAEWQRGLVVSHLKIGEVQSAQGDLGGAFKSFQAGMEIARKLVERDPGNTQWQHDLSASHERIGDVQSAQGDLGGALMSYQARMEITRALAERDPSNAEWQRALSLGHGRFGDVQSAQGDLGGALKSFQAGTEIARKLTERDPGNAEWQTDLAVSCWKLSQLDTPALPKAERRALLERGLAVLEGLQQRGRLTPDKQTWPDLFRQALQKLTP